MREKKRKRRSAGDEDANDGPQTKRTELFSGTSFRDMMKGENPLTALKEFVQLCKTENVALQYLEAGGSALELLGLLQADRKKNMAIVVPVFSAMQYIIISSVTDGQKYRLSTEEACKHLLNYYLSTIHDMLSMKSTAKHRQIVLKLLAAMVTLSTRLAQMVLTHVKIAPHLWNVFLKHTKPVNKSVRTAFIHYIMAFLFDGDLSVLRPLLEFKGFLASIIPGLMYDSADTVHMVLTTIRDKVLMNMGISKTVKLHVFNSSVIKSLFVLYEWKGPHKWKPTAKERQEDTSVLEEEKEETEEDKEIVLEAVHSFLQTLCTTHRYGVIFHDKSIGTSGKKHNELLQTALVNLEKPWEHDLKAELVFKIVAACPDLMKCILSNVEPFLEPRVSVKWVKTINFVKHLILNMDPEHCIKPYIDGLTSHQAMNAVQTLTMPGILLKAISSGMLQHHHLVVRHESLCLLLTMLQQFHRFLEAAENWQPIDEVSERGFKQNIIKQLSASEVIASLWKKLLMPVDENETEEDVQSSQLVEEPNLCSHVSAIIDLALIHNKCFPHVLDLPSTINFFSDIEKIVGDEFDLEAIASVQEKVLQLLISLDSYAFTPDKEMFADAMNQLSHLVDYPSATIPFQARNILCTLLVNTGLFEGILSEVLVWLHCYLTVPADQRKTVVKLLVDSIGIVSKNPTTYVDYVIQAEESAAEENKEVFDHSRIEDIFDELLETEGDEFDKEKNQDIIPSTHVTLSPLLPGVLETASAKFTNDQKEEITHFLSYVVIHLFHSQTVRGIIPQLLHKFPGLVPTAVMGYINGWAVDGSPSPLQKPFESHSPERKISKAVLQPESASVHQILGLNELVESKRLSTTVDSFNIPEPDFECLKVKDPVHILLLYRMSVFYLVQLASRGELTVDLRDKCKDALLSLLKISSCIDKEQSEINTTLTKDLFHLIQEDSLSLLCMKHTLKNPFLLQKFTPIIRKKHVIEKLITELILDLVKLSSTSRKDVQSLSAFLKPYKQKLIDQILKRLKKCQESKMSWLNVEGIVSMIEQFELEFSDVLKLLERIVTVPSDALVCESEMECTLSVWCSLLVHLLDCCVKLHKPVKPGMISLVSNHVTQLSKNEKLDITSLENSVFKYLECFPHHLEQITAKLLRSLLQQRASSTSVAKLCVLLMSHKQVFIHDFISQLRQSKNLRQNVFLVFPLLTCVLNADTPIDQVILSKVYNEHKSEIRKAILKPSNAPEWLKSNISAVVHLMEKCLDVDTRHKLCQDIKAKFLKLRSYEEFYVDLIKCVMKNNNQQVDLVVMLLQMVVSLSKQDSLDEKKMEHVCMTLLDVVSSCGRDINWTSLKMNEIWQDFVKMSLKFGLQCNQDGTGLLLDTLKRMCESFYNNDSEDELIIKIFNWSLSHSEFLNIMLGSSQKKEKLTELLLTLIKKNKSVMTSTHIPVLLSSYSATTSSKDQLILQLLQLYESEGVSLKECRPYLWGEAAVSHYSVRSNIGMSLWRQPNANHVLELFNKDIIFETIRKFPVNRGLQESGNTSLSDGSTYDPAFYLPLFSHLLAPETVIHCFKFVSCGGLALTLAALASTHEDVRAAAYHVLARLHFHVDAMRSAKGRLLGLQFLDAIRSGVSALKTKSEKPQLSCIVTTFLARTSLILPETHNKMYIPLQNFIIAKPTFDMNTVPEFFTFFHSSDLEYRLFRQWILQIIRDGMKSDLDFQLSERCVVFKLLLGFYSSVLCDRTMKKLILEVLESAVTIETAAERLVSKNGLLTWLHHAIQELQFDDIDLTTSVISILFTLWNTLCGSSESSKKKLSALGHFSQNILLLCLELLQKIDSKLPVADLDKFLRTLNGVVSLENTKGICMLISTQIITKILNLCKDILHQVLDCEDLMLYGCKFASRTKNCESYSEAEQAALHFRSLIIVWLNKM